MYVVVSKSDENLWLCCDGLMDDYYWGRAWNDFAVMGKTICALRLNEIPDSFSFNVKKLVLEDIEDI